MYFSYYPVLPSLGFSITFFITGLVVAYVNLNILRTGWKKNLKCDLVLGTLALLFSAALIVSPLHAWCYQMPLPSVAKPLSGFLGMIMFMIANVGMFRTRNDPDFGWRDVWIMLIATALMIIPWFIGMLTETV